MPYRRRAESYIAMGLQASMPEKRTCLLLISHVSHYDGVNLKYDLWHGIILRDERNLV